ncbi:alpha/beta hydrolase, partial [bacterium M00.F.Ca.ET.221.01.1.1]
VSVHNSEVMARALAEAGVEHELHVFAHGGHGFGMHLQGGSSLALWPALTQAWLTAGKGAEGGR